MYKENEFPGMTKEVIHITLKDKRYTKPVIFHGLDELEMLKIMYTPESILELWESAKPKFEEGFKQMICFGTETYKFDKDGKGI